eukprot:111912-Heterocapsa_arctica.AAC.1
MDEEIEFGGNTAREGVWDCRAQLRAADLGVQRWSEGAIDTLNGDKSPTTPGTAMFWRSASSRTP